MVSRSARRMLSRATFGARPGALEAIEHEGNPAWLERQLRPWDIPDEDAERRLAATRRTELEPGDLDGASVGEMADMGDVEDMAAGGDRLEARRRKIRLIHWVVATRLVSAVHSRRELFEVMVDFWGHHFSVYKGASSVGSELPHYEHEVLRPHALGRFEDLLLAVAKSPAMLIYLDNRRSVAVRMQADGTPRGGRGINENYARELLELHTLGVDTGYSQDDVIQTARALTGWGISKQPRVHFRFNAHAHDRGPKTVLGTRLPGRGVEQGEWLLRRLARDPRTAHHLSTKLARRFVADTPPPRLVDRAAQRYLETGGRIDETLRVILLSPELERREYRKLKTPFEYVASILRSSGGETDGGRRLRAQLHRLGNLPYHSRTPDGYPDRAEDWADPAALLGRMNLALHLAKHGFPPGTEIGNHLPETASLTTATPWRSRSAIAFAAPEFQWR